MDNSKIFIDMVRQSNDCLNNFIYNLENNYNNTEIENLKYLYSKNRLNAVKTAGMYFYSKKK